MIDSLIDQKSRDPNVPIDLDVVLHPMNLDDLRSYYKCACDLSFLKGALPNEFPEKDIPILQKDLERRMERMATSIKSGDSSAIEKATQRIREASESMDMIRPNDAIIFKPGIHKYSMHEVERMFAYNDIRDKHFEGFMKWARELKEAGCKTVYLDGSFITRRKDPHDFDACWEPFVPKTRPKAQSLLDESIDGNLARKKEFGGDIFPRFTAKYGDRVEKWQYDERTRRVKGIIEIDLRGDL